MAGETNLMGLEELADVRRSKACSRPSNGSATFCICSTRACSAEGVQIFIGHESGYQLLDYCSIVAAPYPTEDDTMGVLGVIGPTRMAYERVIPIVDVTAKLLGRALKSTG